MRNTPTLLILPLALTVLAPLESYCEVYMDAEKATRILFPNVTFAKRDVTLTDADKTLIKEASGEKVRSDSLQIFEAPSGERVLIDRVLGKHEYITYAVGLSPDGRVKGIEILEYRETYGGQVRDEKWRAQFVGKDKSAALKIDKDIKNISGATLSSVHITDGVRRVLHTFEVIRHRS